MRGYWDQTEGFGIIRGCVIADSNQEPIKDGAFEKAFKTLLYSRGNSSRSGEPSSLLLGLNLSPLNLTWQDLREKNLEKLLSLLRTERLKKGEILEPRTVASQTIPPEKCHPKENPLVVDTLTNQRLWNRYWQGSIFTNCLDDRRGVIIAEFPEYTRPDSILIAYSKHIISSDEYLTPLQRQALDEFATTKPDLFAQGMAESSRRLRARLESCTLVHSPGEETSYRIELSDVPHLHYKVLHDGLADMTNPTLQKLRAQSFKNALAFLDWNACPSRPRLPSHFALHMAIVTTDKKLLMRFRTGAKQFNNHWEISNGEFFNGPDYTGSKKGCFPHCDANGNPDINMFLSEAVREEFGYAGAQPDQFTVWGFAVEQRTLAPKMTVLFESRLSKEEWERHIRTAAEAGKRHSFVDLSPTALAAKFRNQEYLPLTPLSKLSATYALANLYVDYEDKRAALQELHDALAQHS
jgi:hypothetical protein